MSLTELLAREFSPEIRKRGDDYFRRGAVMIQAGSSTRIRALVSGSAMYRVELNVHGNRITSECSCPFFAQYGTGCKHIWAVLRKAEESTHFGDTLPPGAYSKAVGGADKKRSWDEIFKSMRRAAEAKENQGDVWPAGREILYVISREITLEGRGLGVDVYVRERKKNGDFSKLKPLSLSRKEVALLPDERDRKILSILQGAEAQDRYASGYYGAYGGQKDEFEYLIPGSLESSFLPLVGSTGRLFFQDDPDQAPAPIVWDDRGTWVFCLEIHRIEESGRYEIEGCLVRGDEKVSLDKPKLLSAGGSVFFQDRAGPLDHGNAFVWIGVLRKEHKLEVPFKKADELLQAIHEMPLPSSVKWPDELRVTEVQLQPCPQIKITTHSRLASHLKAVLHFGYEGSLISPNRQGESIYNREGRRLVRRDLELEEVAKVKLASLGLRQSRYEENDDGTYELPKRSLPGVVSGLTALGWRVEADGKLFRASGQIRINVSSGVDWFELHGEIDFGNQMATLPAILASLKKGQNTVLLDDGSQGILPEEWLKKYAGLIANGEDRKDHLRFTQNQIGFLDALLSSLPEATCDAVFTHARDELMRFQGIESAEVKGDFQGTLRDYQREGLGWLLFLERFRFGGLLADDMGLGKTVQVLALLERRRSEKKSGSSLIVVPKSLVFNWKREAARFAPKMRVLDHTGMERDKSRSHFDDADLVLTTYGTLRRDILLFKEKKFDYVILDEAQNIKNHTTDSAKAVRLLQGSNRLALSGTPIENHLGELWSLFEFLNPGLLGRSALAVPSGFGDGGKNLSTESRELLARALKPFILRRTKEQVVKDLPTKVEQTLFCELEKKQRQIYNELRDHYRTSLLSKVERDGMGKSKILILEALLRLRQAAIHPGLIDRKKSGEPSAKLDVLLPSLAELVEEGRKVLVFSQFTSMLQILKKNLDQAGMVYEYLDGKTRDREARVERFQNDPSVKIFLISLKAGGVGLNLTSAEYVYILDPWWNPAVEAQAIDRTHRIGQTRNVFAYRIIARDTVEEKILELQTSKRNLADAILGEDNSVIRDIGREDLELLLS